jgi:AbrB family looped-hinge helix DNA binding protein
MSFSVNSDSNRNNSSNIPIQKQNPSTMPVEFHSNLVKWDNSVGFVLPKPIRDGMKLKAGDKLRIVVEDDRRYVEKAK